MPVPKKPCKHCGEINPLHWPYQCASFIKNKARINPKLSGRGKYAVKWLKTRRQWFLDNKSESYICYICGKHLDPIETTLDHVIPRSRAPHLRYEMSNLRPCCYKCNYEKGSKVY